mmetsp:Transcript_27435/g.72055  ORF Transcript_27435/g.72055 Transcript_27435/m.72055 type:complete len:311 (-) Transcript_27435:427-1359(-)
MTEGKGRRQTSPQYEAFRATVLAIPPGIVWVLLAWSYYVYTVLYVPNYILNPLTQALYLAVYHAVLVVFATSFYRTQSIGPLGPPPQFALTEDDMANLEDGTYPGNIVTERRLPIRTLAHNDCIRFCGACKALKPDRAHHCSVCRRCVLKMDHHCPWVGNCVGWHNYKFFVLFLFWGVIYLGTFLCTIAPLVLGVTSTHSRTSKSRVPRRTGQAPILISFLLALSFTISMALMLVFHLFLISQNRSTLEGFAKINFAQPNKRGWRHASIYKNFEEVFGPLSYRWLLPVGRGSHGSGWDFKVHSADGITMV